MNTLQERITRAVRNSPHIPAQVARLSGVSRSAISGWMQGSIKTINGEHCVAVADVLGVSYAWLAAGVGPMNAKAARTTAVLLYLTPEQALDHEHHIDTLFLSNSIDSITLATQELELDQYDFAFRSPDRAMEPRLIKGDTLFMSPQRKPEPGDLVLASIDNAPPILRRYRPRSMTGNVIESYELTPTHADYAASNIGPESNCRIIATVQGIFQAI